MDADHLSAFLPLLATSTLPELGPGPRPGIWPQAELEQKLDSFFRDRKGLDAVEPILRALTLLWHDHLDASHQIAQALHHPTGSLLHGIVHRREPDYSNAKYWFRQAGRHPAFRAMSQQVPPLIRERPESKWSSRLISHGDWNPAAFIDLCEEATSTPGPTAETHLLQRIQELEFRTLLQEL